jgi:hypothetical protein
LKNAFCPRDSANRISFTERLTWFVFKTETTSIAKQAPDGEMQTRVQYHPQHVNELTFLRLLRLWRTCNGMLQRVQHKSGPGNLKLIISLCDTKTWKSSNWSATSCPVRQNPQIRGAQQRKNWSFEWAQCC